VAPNPKAYVILPEIISKEPLAPVVRHGDNQWKDIVNYSVLAMINAEEMGITSKNVDKMLKSKDPKIQRFLGVSPGTERLLGLMKNLLTISLSRSVIMARFLSGMWVLKQSWELRAALTPCGQTVV